MGDEKSKIHSKSRIKFYTSKVKTIITLLQYSMYYSSIFSTQFSFLVNCSRTEPTSKDLTWQQGGSKKQRRGGHRIEIPQIRRSGDTIVIVIEVSF